MNHIILPMLNLSFVDVSFNSQYKISDVSENKKVVNFGCSVSPGLGYPNLVHGYN